MRSRFYNAIYLIAAYAAITGASDVFAHDVHGLTDAHWHATDVWGFVVVGCLWPAAVCFAHNQKWATHDPR